MNENNTQKLLLTKAGVIILVFTLIFSILFIALGIVNLDDDSTENTYTVFEDSVEVLSVGLYEYYELEFEPKHTGIYTIDIEGAVINDIEDRYGNVFFSQSNGEYSVYMSAYETYTIRIYTKNSYVKFHAFL
jgi:hypothetical protein